MTDEIRWGILGASDFAERKMMPAIARARGARVAALATRSADKAAPFRAYDPRIEVFENYDAMLASDVIDAVYVPLPNHLHLEWSVRALEAGKHVLCEKPMAMEAAEFDRLISARDAAGKLAAEAYMIVHHPQWKTARDLIADGAIGQLGYVDAVFSFNNPDPGNIRNQSGTGGGGLRDIGVYAMGCVRFATGEEPVTLDATASFEKDYDTFARVTARFPSFEYVGMVSTRLHPRQRVTFHGDAGHMTLTAPFNAGSYDQAEIILETARNERRVLRWPDVDQYVLQMEAFVASVRDGASYPWTLEHARGTQSMIDTAIAAGAQTA